MVYSEPQTFSPRSTSSSAEVHKLAGPSPLAAIPIHTSSQAAHPTSETAQNVHAFEELPFSTIAALVHQSTAGAVPARPNAPLAPRSRDVSLADLRDGDHADHPPSDPHRRESDAREDAPPTVPGSGAGVLAVGTALLHDAEPITLDLAQLPSRRIPDGDPDIRGEVAADMSETACPVVDTANDGRGPSVASRQTSAIEEIGAGDSDDVEGGGRPGLSNVAAADRQPTDLSDSSEQHADPVVEEHDSEGESRRTLGTLEGGMGIDTDNK